MILCGCGSVVGVCGFLLIVVVVLGDGGVICVCVGIV